MFILFNLLCFSSFDIKNKPQPLNKKLRKLISVLAFVFHIGFTEGLGYFLDKTRQDSNCNAE